MSLDPRQRRVARNETRFRDINERLEAALRQMPETPELLEFVCECGERSCDVLLALRLDEYEAVRRDSRRFVVATGHEVPDAEIVVARGERYTVVEKIGAAVDVADAADRRADAGRGLREGPPTP